MRLLLLLSVLGISALLGAEATEAKNFQEFNDVIGQADTSAKNALGTVGTWIIGMLPIIGLTVGIFGGMKYLRKHSNGQEENFAKELGYGGAGAFLGLVVSMLFISAIGAGLMGESTYSFNVLTEFWTGIFGQGSGGED